MSPRPLVCALGDLLLDVVVRLDGPIASDTDTFGRTRVGAGGQAANVAAWAAALGGRGRAVGKRARDVAGRMVEEELTTRSVEVAGPEADGATGTVVSIATPDGRRTMLTDRGVSPELAPAELDPAWLDGCDWLHVPGYSLVRSPLAETALAAARLAERVSIDVSSTAAVAELGAARFRERLAELRPEIVFATEEEAELVGALEAPTVVVKRGAGGCVVRTAAGDDEHPAHAADAVDTTGAGDAFAAGFLLGGAELALEAAARCVARMGAMP
jgi:sugar/nucleoside kinase (ribokinase family)